MRYAILRLEEEIRIVLDVRRTIPADEQYRPDESASLLIETAKQLRDLVRAVRLLERTLEPHERRDGETTLSPAVRGELIAIVGFATNSKETPV